MFELTCAFFYFASPASLEPFCSGFVQSCETKSETKSFGLRLLSCLLRTLLLFHFSPSLLSPSLTQDLIYERHPDIDVSSLRKLDLPNCGLKHVDLSPIDSFRNLARYLPLPLDFLPTLIPTFYLLFLSLNLEHNSLTSFSGLIYLNKLKVLPARIHFLTSNYPTFIQSMNHNYNYYCTCSVKLSVLLHVLSKAQCTIDVLSKTQCTIARAQ